MQCHKLPLLLQGRQGVRVAAVRASRMHKRLPERRPGRSRGACSATHGRLQSTVQFPRPLCSRPAGAGRRQSGTAQPAQRQPVLQGCPLLWASSSPQQHGLADHGQPETILGWMLMNRPGLCSKPYTAAWACMLI